MKKLLSFLAIALLLITPSQVQAQNAEQIDYFEQNIQVDAAGKATITELIHYDFGGNQRRGLLRDIPTRYTVAGDQGYIVDLAVSSVTRGGESEPFTLLNDTPNAITIRTGEENVFLDDSQQQYVITYSLGPVAIAADDGNEIIRLDAPGTGWDVPTKKVNVQIEGPISAQSQTCYKGFARSTDQTCDVGSGTGFVSYSSDDLSPGETMTVEAVYPAGTFSELAQQQDITAITESSGPPAFILGIFGLIGSIVAFFGIKRAGSHIRHNSRKKDETIYPIYEPPHDMTAGDIGLLIDNTVDGAELSATLLWLATRGYIKINLVEPKSTFRSAKYTFQKLKDGAGLPNYETQLIDTMFEGESTEVTMDHLKNSIAFAQVVQNLKSAHVGRLESMGFYGPSSIMASDLDARTTDAGYKKWSELAGFKMFLEFTEKDRLAFHDAPEKRPEQFSEMLPFAVALGVEKQWVDQFKDLQVDTSGWYGTPNGFATGYTIGTISQMSSDLNNFSVHSVSSGTSSAGGGFSGGGFGGGGGSSW